MTKDKHFLTPHHLKSDDKMNFDAVVKIMSPMVQNLLLEHIQESNGTVMFLKIIQYVIDSFLSKSIQITERLYMIWYAVLILRIWRFWLKQNNYSITKNFITLNSYTCIELNAHALVVVCLKCTNESQSKLFLPWYMSSQPCERLFRAVRSMTSTFSTVVNFSMLDILHRIHKLQMTNEIISDTGKWYFHN